jgi:hypothetical protein
MDLKLPVLAARDGHGNDVGVYAGTVFQGPDQIRLEALPTGRFGNDLQRAVGDGRKTGS